MRVSKSMFSMFSDTKVDPAALFELEQAGHSREDATVALKHAKRVSKAQDTNYVLTVITHQEHIRRRKDLCKVVTVGDRIPVADMWEPSCAHCGAEKQAYAAKEAASLEKWAKQAAKPPSKVTRFSTDEELAAHYLQVAQDHTDRAVTARRQGRGGAGDDQLARHYLQVAQQHAERARHRTNRAVGQVNLQHGEWEDHLVNNKKNRDMAAHNTAVLRGLAPGAHDLPLKPAPEVVLKREFLY